MPLLSKLQVQTFVVLIIISGALASPLASKIETLKYLLGRDVFEWTALGDSYSSGVGAGEYTWTSYRCLRYDHAYPVLTNGDTRLPEGDHHFNNVVCSGSNTADVQAYQFFDEDTSGQPTWQYGTRPKFGNPSMATLTVGGNDIDFPGIIFNCILDFSLPTGPVLRPCDEQRQVTWALLNSADLEENIDKTIKKVVERGRKGTIGDKFKLYVTGFPQFFSEKTDECDSVTFARGADPIDDGREHPKMTQEVRKEYNSMSVHLNQAIENAVSRNTDQGVKYIPIDDAMDGHRYCEPGVQEPDQHNDNLWLFHYPYYEPWNDAIDRPLLAAFHKVTDGVDINATFRKYNDFQSALFDAVDFGNDANSTTLFDLFWGLAGKRVKVFHPQIPFHEKIRDLVLDSYISDVGGDETPTPPPATPFEEKNACHGVSGDYWVMSRDTAVANAEDFCQQREKNITYNSGSVNELKLSVQKLDDDSKGPADAPDCTARFRDVVIDGCDGNDNTNNPHNYKFGSTFTSADGWEYTMTPLSRQVDEVSCDVSYKFFLDSFEVRGKNLPWAKFGANGEGLKSEISGCGAVTEWNFEWTPDDVKFQWYASGQLPIGTKSCVGSALVTAGGADDGNCEGAGKRSVNTRRPDGIEDWPGYGDEGKHVFKNPVSEKRDSIDEWPGYSDADKHVFKHPASD
ncbi:SGNH hydrolase-type esterase domain-containing protein [Hypoxylon sp. NC1633]|nr:SGNH hydrolase-type esterase domain-containing protein [Hypoxylon sp. NC1633]